MNKSILLTAFISLIASQASAGMRTIGEALTTVDMAMQLDIEKVPELEQKVSGGDNRFHCGPRLFPQFKGYGKNINDAFTFGAMKCIHHFCQNVAELIEPESLSTNEDPDVLAEALASLGYAPEIAAKFAELQAKPSELSQILQRSKIKCTPGREIVLMNQTDPWNAESLQLINTLVYDKCFSFNQAICDP